MNIIPFPRAPFFCADEGRCLPELTPRVMSDVCRVTSEALAEVEIDFAICEQRLQIEQDLLRIKLKQKCFVALSQATVRGTAQTHNLEKRGATPRPATTVCDSCDEFPVSDRMVATPANGGSEISPADLISPDGPVGFKPDAPSAFPLDCSAPQQAEFGSSGPSGGRSAMGQHEGRPRLTAEEHNAYPKGRW